MIRSGRLSMILDQQLTRAHNLVVCVVLDFLHGTQGSWVKCPRKHLAETKQGTRYHTHRRPHTLQIVIVSSLIEASSSILNLSLFNQGGKRGWE